MVCLSWTPNSAVREYIMVCAPRTISVVSHVVCEIVYLHVT
jgi:hypothetical protein